MERFLCNIFTKPSIRSRYFFRFNFKFMFSPRKSVNHSAMCPLRQQRNRSTIAISRQEKPNMNSISLKQFPKFVKIPERLPFHVSLLRLFFRCHLRSRGWEIWKWKKTHLIFFPFRLTKHFCSSALSHSTLVSLAPNTLVIDMCEGKRKET